LLGSIIFNYTIGRNIDRADQSVKQQLLIVSVVANLELLSYYKYTNFFIENASAVFGQNWSEFDIIFH